MSTLSSEEGLLRVIEVTGASKVEARYLLSACANNPEQAVALYFERLEPFEQGGARESIDLRESESIPIPIEDTDSNDEGDDDVRAPIAPIREQLVHPEDDNFYAAAAPPTTTTSNRLPRMTQRMKVCPLRDFAREAALLEAQLQAASTESSVSSNANRRRTRTTALFAAQEIDSTTKPTTSRLGDLFRPPTDITYAGTFQAARTRATDCKCWLLVNVQSDNFASQVLNRDVWSDKEVRKLIKRQFMLWQVDADSSQGRRFVAFYHCAKLPYVCVIDPRTGEEMWKSASPKQTNILPDLLEFLREHKDFSTETDDDAPSTSKRIKLANNEDGNGEDTRKRTKLMELSEEEQIALAIRNSIRENGDRSGTVSQSGYDEAESDSDNTIEEFVDDDTKTSNERTSYEEKLGNAKNELTMLKLRFLNASGVDEVVQLRWPSNTLVEVLRLYIAQTHSHIPNQGYKLICAFPRKTLEMQDDKCTLKEMGLHPSANLHVTLED